MNLTNIKRNVSKNRNPILWVLLLFGMTTITACSGGSTSTATGVDGSGSSTALTGVFLDSPVDGLHYQTATISGLTDENGTFMYHEGEAVTFMIGDVMLGSAPGNNIMTPIDLVPGAVDETHPIVTNICRLLQSLDQDGNLENGIMITEIMHSEMTDRMIDITLEMAEFENYDMEALFNSLNVLGAFSDGDNRVLLTPVEAQSHFRQTLMGNMGGFMHTGDPLSGSGQPETGMSGMP